MAGKLVVARSWSLHSLTSTDFRSLARSEAKAGSGCLQLLTTVGVGARSWNFELVKLRLKLDTHGEARVLSPER